MSADPTDARATYDAFAASYDDFNHRYRYAQWTGRLLDRALEAGLSGDRLLDVGCGTGLSLISLLEDGWQVCGCDISPAMVERAREKVGDRADLRVADMRALPDLGEFDLVWAVNDAINYLMSEADLRASLEGMRRNLAPGGVVVFDVNTIATYRRFFAAETVVERGDRKFVWRGSHSSLEACSGSVFEATFNGEGPGVTAHTHRQRHFPEAAVGRATAEAGLDCARVYGELDGGLEPALDEGLHTKAVYVCRAAGDGRDGARERPPSE